MDSLLPSTDSSVKSPGLSGLLSSLGSMLSGSSISAGAFAQFLEQNQGALSIPLKSATPDASTQNTVSQNDEQNPSTGGALTVTLKTIVSDLRHIIHQLSNRDGNQAVSHKTRVSDTTQTGNTKVQAAAANPQQTGTSQTQPRTGASGHTTADVVSPAGDDNSPAISSGAPNAGGGDVANPQTLAQILSALVMLMQVIEKKMEMAQTAGGTDATPATSLTDPVSPADPTTQPQQTDATDNTPLADILAQTGITGTTNADADNDANSTNPVFSGNAENPTSAANPLAQLLALIQAVEQKLASSSSGALQLTAAGTADSVSVSMQSSPAMPALPDFSQIQQDLKGLLASLKNVVANSNLPANDSSGNNTVNVANTANPNDLSVPTGLFMNTPDPAQTGKPTDALSADLSNFFGNKINNIFGNVSPTDNFASVSANSLITDAQNGGQTDSNAQNDGSPSSGDDTGNAGGLSSGNTPLPALADGIKATDPYSFASQLSATRATTGGMTGLPSAVEQVLLQLNRGAKDGNDQMTIQLQPADLGKVNIKLDISADGKVQGTVVADNPATLNLLLKDVRGLERALQEAGLRADPGSLQFSLGGQSGNTSGQTASDFANGQSSSSNTLSGTGDTSLDVSANPDEVWIVTPGRVNLKV